jgi:hypothetical protein
VCWTICSRSRTRARKPAVLCRTPQATRPVREDPLSEALIQGTLPRPSELEVYLGDSGIYCRPLAGELQEQPVGAPSDESEDKVPAAGTPLYMF